MTKAEPFEALASRQAAIYTVAAQPQSEYQLVVARTIMWIFTNLLHPIGIFGAATIFRVVRESRWGRHAQVLARIGSDSRFCVPAFDPYWSQYIYTQRVYEEELFRFFYKIRHLEFSFIDCGANYGLWSTLMSSSDFGTHYTIAIEASTETFQRLCSTNNANGARFVCLNRAVSDYDGMHLAFSNEAKHLGRHVVEGARPPEDAIYVESITLDTVYRTFLPPDKAVVVKLDVEGSEIRAFEGADAVSSSGAVFVYEDHGKNEESATSRYLLWNDFDIYYPHRSGRLERVNSMDDVKKIKCQSHRGYNFVALKANNLWAQKFREVIQTCEN